MAKIADRPHSITIVMSLVAIVISALGVYVSYERGHGKDILPTPTDKKPTEDPEAGRPLADRNVYPIPWQRLAIGRYSLDQERTDIGLEKIGGKYILTINSPEATFNCRVIFDTNTDPEYAGDCKITRNKEPSWWTDDRIVFTCDHSVPARIDCIGSYDLHYGARSYAGKKVPPRKSMTMELIRLEFS